MGNPMGLQAEVARREALLKIGELENKNEMKNRQLKSEFLMGQKGGLVNTDRELNPFEQKQFMEWMKNQKK